MDSAINKIGYDKVSFLYLNMSNSWVLIRLGGVGGGENMEGTTECRCIMHPVFH